MPTLPRPSGPVEFTCGFRPIVTEGHTHRVVSNGPRPGVGSVMKLSLVSIDNTGIVRVMSEGEITSRDFDDARNPLEGVLGAGWAANRVSMDLSKASFIDSRAIGWLMECQKRFKEKGGKLALHSPPPRVTQVLDLLRMRQALNIMDNEAAAKAYLTGGTTPGAGATPGSSAGTGGGGAM